MRPIRSAVLFLVFNRPDTTRRVFEAIRAARPPRLYVAADGPRATKPMERERCEEVRGIATAIDWPCQVRTLFRETNLGCKLGVSGALDWFFDQEQEGVILEDDVLPLPTFFDYCDELLERFRADPRIAMITGCNLISKHFHPQTSYFFSNYNHIWGWGSWRRAWRGYDVAMNSWPAWRDSEGLERLSGGGRLFASYWRTIFDDVHAGKIDTWDYQWIYACWRAGALTAIPEFNQTRNLGFGADATHTTTDEPDFVKTSMTKPLTFPLTHPTEVRRDVNADRIIASKVFGITPLKAFNRLVKKIKTLHQWSLPNRAGTRNDGAS